MNANQKRLFALPPNEFEEELKKRNLMASVIAGIITYHEFLKLGGSMEWFDPCASSDSCLDSGIGSAVARLIMGSGGK